MAKHSYPRKKKKLSIIPIIFIILIIAAIIVVPKLIKNEKDKNIVKENITENRTEGEQGVIIPKIADKGTEITLSAEELEKVKKMIEYANFFYSPEWNQNTLSDVILANTGFALTQDTMESMEIKKEIFDDAIYNYFGRNISEPEKLDTGIIKFEGDHYTILPIGAGEEGIYEHKFLRAYDLGNGYIKIECSVDYILYDLFIGEDVLTEDVGTAVGILKKVPESLFGYNFIAYSVKVDMR